MQNLSRRPWTMGSLRANRKNVLMVLFASLLYVGCESGFDSEAYHQDLIVRLDSKKGTSVEAITDGKILGLTKEQGGPTYIWSLDCARRELSVLATDRDAKHKVSRLIGGSTHRNMLYSVLKTSVESDANWLYDYALWSESTSAASSEVRMREFEGLPLTLVRDGSLVVCTDPYTLEYVLYDGNSGEATGRLPFGMDFVGEIVSQAIGPQEGFVLAGESAALGRKNRLALLQLAPLESVADINFEFADRIVSIHPNRDGSRAILGLQDGERAGFVQVNINWDDEKQTLRVGEPFWPVGRRTGDPRSAGDLCGWIEYGNSRGLSLILAKSVFDPNDVSIAEISVGRQPSSGIFSYALSLDGRTIAFSTGDNSVEVWQVSPPKATRLFGGKLIIAAESNDSNGGLDIQFE
jgi:hypothetical protein